MFNKKYYLFISLLVFTLVVFSPAPARAEDFKQTYDNVKNTIEKNWPDWLKNIQKEIIPFCEKTWKQGNDWLMENMPAAADELKRDSQTLPQEFIEYLQAGWNWLLNFLKK